MDIAGKVFVVTGGGNGIGREVVLELLRRGARVAAVDLSSEGLAGTAALAAAGDRLSEHSANITDRAAVEALPAAVVAAHGQVDALVNVAGIIHRFVPVQELSFDEIERVMNVNFWGTVNTTKIFLPTLLERPVGAILNVSSMGGLVPVPGQSAYGASKAAVKLFTEGLYAELLDTTVQVTVVFPGGVGTNITGNSGVSIDIDPEKAAKAAKNITSPESAGRQIVDAIAAGKPRLRIGNDAKMLDRISRFNPVKAISTVAKQMKAMMP